jgi:hypothetical protein
LIDRGKVAARFQSSLTCRLSQLRNPY